MSQSPLISVIVPVYKVEPYLDRCVESIVNQTYENLEIILVDDGSPDNCPAMCDAWAEEDARIRVIHKENGGLSDARNAGMAVASGELMGFIDSDDWIHPDMYRKLYENMAQNGSDISACGVEMVWEDGTPSRMLTAPGCCVMDTEEALLACIEETSLKQPIWYKLYKTALIRDLPFPVGKCHEDVFWTYQAVGRAKKVSVFDTPLYYYLQRSGSIMGQGYSLKRLDGLEAKVQRLTFITERFPALLDAAALSLHFSCLYAMQMTQAHMTGRDRKTAEHAIQDAFSAVKRHRYTTDLSPKQQLWATLSRFSLSATAKLRNFLKIGL